MRRVLFGVAMCLLAGTAVAADPKSSGGPPAWAYPSMPGMAHVQVSTSGRLPVADAQLPPTDNIPKRVPNSNASFSTAQLFDLYNVADWHPDSHPPAPDIVMKGRNPGVFACGFCHMPNGMGRPENTSVAGLPVAYIVQQMADFKSGARQAAEPNMIPQKVMAAIAKATTDAEVQEAAAYFASLKPVPIIRVVESDTAPKTRFALGLFVAEPGEEPLGNRIVEVPEDTERTELRDYTAGYVAYVPRGSLKKGAALVAGANGRITPCGTCHGADLRGLGPIPALAGRSPSSTMRQLYDLKHGTRAGVWSPLMADVVGKLDEADMLAISAYTASLAP